MSELSGGGPEVKLLCLCAGDPKAKRPFSGSAKSLFEALGRLGCVHASGNVLGWTDPFAPGVLPLRLLRRIDRLELEDRYRWTQFAWDRNTRRAEAFAAEHPGYNAVLMYGTTYNPGVSTPKYVYLDATSAQVSSARAWEFAHFSEHKIRDVVAYQRRIFEECAAVFPRSNWAAESLRQDYGIGEEKIVIAGAGSNFDGTPLPHGSYANARILFIGVEWERKGGPLIVEAFREVRRVIPHATLAIVGCSPDIREPGVEIIGMIPRSDPAGQRRLLEEYSRASVFCIMSEYEPFGIVMLEAESCGVPCVAPDRYAFPETIRDGETGALKHHYDARLLAKKLIELLSNPTELERMGKAAKEWVASEWTWDIAARRIRDRIAADLAARRDVNAVNG